MTDHLAPVSSPSSPSLDRRALLAAAAGSPLVFATPKAQDTAPKPKKKLKQSVARWIYNRIPLDEFCQHAKDAGLAAIDLLAANEWMTPKKHGLECSMAFGPKSHQIGHGLNRLEHHDEMMKEAENIIPRIGEAGIRSMILFSGNRGGQDDATGIKNCIAGMERLLPLAEKHNVVLCLEYLNSKVDHKDYQFDKMGFGLEVVKPLKSKYAKILYDIYHVQIMEGDIIRVLKENIAHIGHFHTGGVPGRRDIDDTQELNYPAICRAILETDYDGFVAHEYIPKGDPIETLKRCAKLCDV